jgi:hypothetical protein
VEEEWGGLEAGEVCVGLTDSTVSFELNRVAYSAVDVNSILHGNPIGSADETEPWTQIGDFLKSGSTGVPDPASFGLLGMGLLSVAFGVRRGK